MSSKAKILFICQHNSGRSQMAEAYLKKFYGEKFDIESAGFEPAASVHPLVIQVMKEVDIDLSTKKPQSVFDLFKEGRLFDHIVTVCHDDESRCPIFPGITKRWHWPFPDPADVDGSEAEKLEQVRHIREMIKDWLLNPPDDSINFKSLMV
jgi:arsenate reductase